LTADTQMDLANLPLVVRPMQPAHIPAVMTIEQQSFALPWPESAYRHEITQNELAHYYVLGFRSALTVSGAGPMSAWQQVMRAARARMAASNEVILGYGGFWLMVDEAHISTLAIRDDVRGRGLGELLLVALLEEARRVGTVCATLEVRVSNVAARALYGKYRFEQVGRRKSYYQDNQEDALILTTPSFASDGYWPLVERQHTLLRGRLRTFSLDTPESRTRSGGVDG
jgi:[ribosomal protein S18]-alanine N-acetyltransferase